MDRTNLVRVVKVESLNNKPNTEPFSITHQGPPNGFTQIITRNVVTVEFGDFVVLLYDNGIQIRKNGPGTEHKIKTVPFDKFDQLVTP